jgi:hypothetical protein
MKIGIFMMDGTAYSSGAHEFTPDFKWGRVPPSLVLCVMLSRSSFCPFSVDHRVVCPFDYTFGIHKLLLDFHRKMGYVGKRLVTNDNEKQKVPLNYVPF